METTKNLYWFVAVQDTQTCKIHYLHIFTFSADPDEAIVETSKFFDHPLYSLTVSLEDLSSDASQPEPPFILLSKHMRFLKVVQVKDSDEWGIKQSEFSKSPIDERMVEIRRLLETNEE